MLNNLFSPEIFLIIPAIIIAMSIHEAAHAYSAYYYGDDTAKAHGRLTLNPLAHIDPIGFLLLIVAGFGWAKPVPVNPRNFRGNKRLADFVVSVAGIATNLTAAALTLSIMKHVNITSQGLFNFLQTFVRFNIILAVFNILPIPPLDGSKMLAALLPSSMARVIWFLDQYGMFILMLLVFTNVIGMVLSPMVNFVAVMLMLLP